MLLSSTGAGAFYPVGSAMNYQNAYRRCKPDLPIGLDNLKPFPLADLYSSHW